MAFLIRGSIMSESIRYTIQNELLDLYDDVKVGLSDLNEQNL